MESKSKKVKKGGNDDDIQVEQISRSGFYEMNIRVGS